jgi:hypothetical protein
MSKARDLANAGTALTTVSATELGYLDGVTSAVQTQIDSKIGQSTAINPSIVTTKGDILAATGSGTIVRQGVGTDGQYLQADSTQADGIKWATVSAVPESATATVATAQTTATTTYTDLATAGPAVTITTGTKALVIVTANLAPNSLDAKVYMDFAISGATTRAASDTTALMSYGEGQAYTGQKYALPIRASVANLVTLTAGSNTFTAKYRVTTETGQWSDRTIFVMNLG